MTVQTCGKETTRGGHRLRTQCFNRPFHRREEAAVAYENFSITTSAISRHMGTRKSKMHRKSRQPTAENLMTVSLDRDAVNFHADDGKPRCQMCTGCTSVLQKQHLNVSFGPFRYTNEAGASSASVFRASSLRAADGWGVAKTFCFEKRHKNGEVYNMPPCDSNPGSKLKHLQTIGRMVAMQALADECGIADVTVRHWRERIKSSNPNTGIRLTAKSYSWIAHKECRWNN